MPLTRQQKADLIESYESGLAKAPHVFLVDFKGVSVPEATELRSRLRAAGSHYLVVKNRLALLAIKGEALEQLAGYFEGPVAAAFCESDPVSLAKALTEFAKEVPALELKAGLVEGQPVVGEEIREIASLPGREELIAKLLFLLQSPIVRFARSLSEIRRQFVVVLGEIAKGKEN